MSPGEEQQRHSLRLCRLEHERQQLLHASVRWVEMQIGRVQHPQAGGTVLGAAGAPVRRALRPSGTVGAATRAQQVGNLRMAEEVGQIVRRPAVTIH